MIRCGTDLDGITEKAMHKVGEVAKTKSDQTLALYTEEEIKSATKTCTAPKNSASSKTEVNVSEVSSTSGEAQQPRASTKSIFMDLYDEGVVDLLTVNSAFGAQKSGDKFPSAETNFKPRQIEFKKDSKQALSLVQEYVDSETEEDKEDVVKETDKKIAPVVKTSSEKSADVETSTSVDNDAVSELKNVSDQNVKEPDITSGKSSSKELSASIKTEVSKKEASKEEKDIRQNAAAKTDKVKEEGQISESDSSNSLSSSDEKHSKKPRESKRDKHRKKRTKEKKKKKKKRKKRRYRGRSIESGSESDKGVKRKKRNRSNSNEKPAKSRQRKRSKSKSREKVSDRRHRSRSRSNSREKRKRQRHGKEKRTRSTSRSRSRSRSRSPIRRYSRSKQRKNSKTFSSRSRSPNKSSSPSAWRKRQRSLSSGRSPSRNSQSSYKRWKSRSKTPQRRLSSGGRKRRSSPLSKSPTRRVLSAVRRKSTPERKRKRSLSSPESPIRRSRSPKRKRDHKKRPSVEQKHPRRLSSGSGNFKRALSKRTDSDEESSDSSSSSGKSPVRAKRAAVSVLRPQLKVAESLKKISQSDRKDSKSLRRKLSGEGVSIGKSSAKKATAQKQGDSAAIRSVVRSAGRKNFKSLRRKLWDEEVPDGKSLGKKPAVQKQGGSGVIRSSVKSAKSGKQNSRSATKSTPRNFVKISFSYSDESDQESIDTNLPEKKSPAVEKTDNVTFSCHVKLAEMKSAEIKRESDLKDSESLKEISASKALDELEAKSSDVKSSEGKSPVIEKTDVSAFKSPKKATESTKETLGSDREDFKKVPESNKTELDEESADSESLDKLSPAPEKTDSVAVTSQIESTEAAKQQSPSPSPAKLDDDEFDFVFTGHLTPKQGSEKSVEDMIFAGEPFVSDAMIWDVKKPASKPNTKQRAKETPAVESQTSGNDGSQGPDALIENNAEKEGIIDTDATDVREVESQEVNTTKSETALHVEENVQSDIPEDLQDNVKPVVETSVKEGQQSPLRDNHFVEAGDVEQDDEAPECKESPNKGESNVSAFVASKVETIPFLDEMPPPPPPMIGASGPHPSRRGPLPTPPHCHSWQDPVGESIGHTQPLRQLDQEPLGHPLKLGVAGHLSSHESNSRSVAGLPGFLGQSVQPPQGPHLSLLSRLGKIGFLQNVPPLGDVNSAQANLAREQLTRFGGNEINPGRNDLCPLPVPVQEEGNVMFEYSPIDMEMSSPEGDIIDKMNEEFWKQQHEDSERELEELEARNAFVEHGTIELFPADEPYEPETGLLIDDMEEDFNDIMDPKERKKRRKEKQHEKTKVQTLIDKLHRQARVEEEVKHVLKVYYKHRDIDKEEYKNILRRAVPQVTNSGSSIDPERIRSLVKKYVAKIKGQRILAV